MPYWHTYAIALIPLLALALHAGAAPVPPAGMLPESSGEWGLAETATFDRTNLFSFIDGGAEVYLAYDFRRAWVGTYTAAGQPRIAVELYDMGNSDDAYGVLSVDPTGEHVAVGSMARYGAGLLRFCKGAWFVRVLAEDETPAARERVLALGEGVAARITEAAPPPALLSLLPAEGQLPDTATYFHTQVTLNQLYFLAEGNLLRLGPNVSAALATYRVGKAEAKLLLVRYPNADECKQARDAFVGKYLEAETATADPVVRRLEDKRFGGVLAEPPYLLLSLEAPRADAAVMLLSKAKTALGGGGTDARSR